MSIFYNVDVTLRVLIDWPTASYSTDRLNLCRVITITLVGLLLW